MPDHYFDMLRKHCQNEYIARVRYGGHAKLKFWYIYKIMWFSKTLYLCLFRELCFITIIQIKLCSLILYYSKKIIQATQQKCFFISRHVYYTFVAHSCVSVCPLKPPTQKKQQEKIFLSVLNYSKQHFPLHVWEEVQLEVLQVNKQTT